jgi:hypothetical protein
MPFLAGVYGKVVPPNPADSAWNTIAIQPFFDAAATVQYLHAQSSNVSIGDTVAPWTVVGVTGNTSPTPVPVHLHIQVVYQRPPKHACWGSRDFVDPETWDQGEPLVGFWHCSMSQNGWTQDMVLHIENGSSSGRIGSQRNNITVSYGCTTQLVVTSDVICTGISQKNIMTLQTQNTNVSIVSNGCHMNPAPTEMAANVSLDGASGLSMVASSGAQAFFTKGTGFGAQLLGPRFGKFMVGSFVSEPPSLK